LLLPQPGTLHPCRAAMRVEQMVEREEAAEIEEEEEEDFGGYRRWGQGALKYDMTYYTYADFLDYVKEKGIDHDQFGNPGFEAAAKDLFKRAVTKEQEESWLINKRANDIQKLDFMPLDEFMQGSEEVILELKQDLTSSGNSLMMQEDCTAAFKGGSGPRTVLGIEVVTHAPTMQVRIRGWTGAYLRALPGAMDFRGSNEDGTIFEVLPRDCPVPLVTIGIKDGGAIGTFAPRIPKSSSLKWWAWRQNLMNSASALMEQPEYQGRKRHPRDTSGNHYTFKEWVAFVQEWGWGGPVENGALVLAQSLWINECVGESEGEWDMVEPQGNTHAPMEE